MPDEEITIMRGSDNVFADLGFPAAAEHKFKAALVSRIGATMQERKLTQSAAARLIGIDQGDLSRLLSGKFRSFSSDRLLDLLRRFDFDIEVTIRRAGEQVGETIHYAAT